MHSGTRKRALAALSAAFLLVVVAAPDAGIAATKRDRCLAAASDVVGARVRGKDYRLVLGTSGKDRFRTSARRDLICGFDGADRLRHRSAPLKNGDIFIGGKGDDRIFRLKGGLFAGGLGDDTTVSLERGHMFGGRGDDVVETQRAGIFEGEEGFDWVTRLDGGRFIGAGGEDAVGRLQGGTFDAGAGHDHTDYQYGGTFQGGPGDEILAEMRGGSYEGGEGYDLVWRYLAGALTAVEKCRSVEEAVCP